MSLLVMLSYFVSTFPGFRVAGPLRAGCVHPRWGDRSFFYFRFEPP